MSDMRYTVKDSVFSFIFRQPEYTRKLYLALHPEDSDVTEADCKLVTLEHVLTNGITNDLGFQVRDRLILLVEAQSKFSANIPLRMLLYLAATYKEHVDEHELDLHSSKAVSIPRPELYMIYGGPSRELPEVLRLSDLYGGGPGGAEVEIRVLRETGERDIVDQYIRFCAISDEMRGRYGYTVEAAEETLRQCIREDILMPLLETRMTEVRDIMVTLFDQQRVTEIHEKTLVREARRDERKKALQEGIREGRREGRQEERQRNIRAMILTLKEFTTDKAVVAQKISKSFGLPLQDAEALVEQHWVNQGDCH